MKLPSKLKMLFHEVKIIYTDDLNQLNGDNFGHYETANQKIIILNTLSKERQEEILFHEIYEYLLAIFHTSYNHIDFERFSTVLFAVLKENGLFK